MKQSLHREAELLERYRNNQLTEEERRELEQWAGESEARKALIEKFRDEKALQKELSVLQEGDKEQVWKMLQAVDGNLPDLAPAKVRRIWPPLVAAAAVIGVVVFIGLMKFNKRNEKPNTVAVVRTPSDIAPGTNKATLRLADGRLIDLDSAQKGTLAQEGSVAVVNQEGRLEYAPSASSTNPATAVAYNTVTTARGQTYPIVLSDHSRIWLNAESSIRFPVAFSGTERRVEITGEAYFEVAHDATRPFIATVNGVQIQVLGTQFNINAYPDEDAIKTTLVSGSVRVTKGIRQTTIQPGQQADVVEQGINVRSVDVNDAVAWKKGYFSFRNTDVPTLMRQIARWYDVQVVYEGPVPKVELSGETYRTTTLSGLLKLLKFSGVNHRIEGRRVIVSE